MIVNASPIIVIQCAGSKRSHAGCFRLRNGGEVLFVSDPDKAPQDEYTYAHPDGQADIEETWRKQLLRYNDLHKDVPGGNPLGLLPVWRLYKNPTYALLAEKYGLERLYILSAGWGLIRANFLTPRYDITFNTDVKSYKRRRGLNGYDDWRMLPDDTAEPIVFFGEESYIDLFCALTGQVKGTRHVFFNSPYEPDAPGCHLRKFDTSTSKNWHYECARAFMDGKVGICGGD